MELLQHQTQRQYPVYKSHNFLDTQSAANKILILADIYIFKYAEIIVYPGHLSGKPVCLPKSTKNLH